MKASKARERQQIAEHRDTIKALVLSMPPALAIHFGALSHCMEASVVGTRILRAQGIEARPLPCAVRATDEATCCLTSGYTQAELRAMAEALGGELGAGHVSDFVGEDSSPFHIVIEAQPRGGRTLIDLTIGQLIPTVAAEMPIAEGWPAARLGAWRVEYDESPRASYVEAEIVKAQEVAYAGLQGDVEEMMKLAKHVRCDREKFYTTLLHQQRDLTMRFLQIAESGLWSRSAVRPAT